MFLRKLNRNRSVVRPGRSPVETLEQRLCMAAPTDVVALVLYNADTGQPIGPFENGTALNYAALPTRNLSVQAITAGSVGSVKFGLDGNGSFHTENHEPFFLVGERLDNGKPKAWTPSAGVHTMSVTAFGADNAAGGAGQTRNVTFSVGGDPAQAPTPPQVSGAPVVTFSDNSAEAKEAGLDRGTFVVSRTGSTATTLRVAYTVSGSASNGADYETLSGVIDIPAGRSSANFIVVPKEDTLVEGTENLVVTLAGGSGYTVGASKTATAPILDNDTGTTPTPTPPPVQSAGTNISDITWTRNAPRSPLPRTEAGSIQIGSKIYAIGGFTVGTGSFFPLTRRVHVYDMANRQWKELASLPSQAAGNHFGAATDGKYIYTVAGQIKDTYGAGTNTVWRYDIAANKWTQFSQSLPAIRFGGTAFIANGHLHFVGGNKSDRESLSTDHWAVNLANPNEKGWERRASIPLGGDHMSHAEINGKFYLFGGEHGHHGLDPHDHASYIQHKYTFEYNPANDTWTRKADMPIALSHVEGSTLAIKGKAVLIGGLLDGGSPNQTSRVHVYDPATNKWKTLATRYPKRIIGSESGYWNGKIYMTDGYSPDADDRQVGFEGTVKFV